MSTPATYRPADPTDAAVVARGEALENAAISQLSAVRPAAEAATPTDGYASAPWSVSLSQSDANAWLATRLMEWLASRGSALPQGFSAPAVSITSNNITVSAAAEYPLGIAIISIDARTWVAPSGELMIQLGGVRAGRLPLPAAAINALSDLFVSFQKAALGKPDISPIATQSSSPSQPNSLSSAPAAHLAEPIAFPPVSFNLDDGRRVELIALEAVEGKIVLTLRTRASR